LGVVYRTFAAERGPKRRASFPIGYSHRRPYTCRASTMRNIDSTAPRLAQHNTGARADVGRDARSPHRPPGHRW
jgi:hypothetical protein